MKIDIKNQYHWAKRLIAGEAKLRLRLVLFCNLILSMGQPVFTHLWGRLDIGLGPSQKATQGTRTAEAGAKQGGHGELEYGYAPPM